MTNREEFFEGSKSWAEGQASSVARETRIAWRVAAGASAIAFLLALALASLLPLKTVQPYVLSVDRQTGAIEPAMSVGSGSLTQNEAVIQGQLASYVVARETFDATDLNQKYRQVQVMSSRPVAQAYVAQMSTANPESPLRSLTTGDTVSILVRSVSLISDNAALVRFTATRAAAGGAIARPINYVAAISFGFNGRPLRQSDRYTNPLGFQVTRYRRDGEGLL